MLGGEGCEERERARVRVCGAERRLSLPRRAAPRPAGGRLGEGERARRTSARAEMRRRRRQLPPRPRHDSHGRRSGSSGSAQAGPTARMCGSCSAGRGRRRVRVEAPAGCVPPSTSSRRPLDELTMCKTAPAEISLVFLVATLGANALTRNEPHLSTALTPDPSFHLRSVPARFFHLSFRKPGTELYYKGRECVVCSPTSRPPVVAEPQLTLLLAATPSSSAGGSSPSASSARSSCGGSSSR